MNYSIPLEQWMKINGGAPLISLINALQLRNIKLSLYLADSPDYSYLWLYIDKSGYSTITFADNDGSRFEAKPLENFSSFMNKVLEVDKLELVKVNGELYDALALQDTIKQFGLKPIQPLLP